MSVSVNDMTKALVDAGIPSGSIQLYDEDFVLTTPDWITNKLGAAMNKFLFDTGIKFQYEQFDCVKFAKTASTIADWCWAETKVDETSLAFGLFAFISDDGPHMINVAVHKDQQGKLFVAFYEPQPGVPDGHATFSTVCLLPQKLEKEAIQSCLGCLFL